MEHFDPESIDLAELTRTLQDACGHALEDLVVGRTTLRDEVVQRLDCSMLEAEHMVDTLVARGFVRQAALNDGRDALLIGES